MASYYINGAPPGWTWCMQSGCEAGVGQDARTMVYSARWWASSSLTGLGRHALGARRYALSIAPLDASMGDLYTAQMHFSAVESFDGNLSSSGGSATGSCNGLSFFSYSGSQASLPFHGGGGGTGGGGRPLQRVRWRFAVQETRTFEVSTAAEQAGLTTASYLRPAQRQCSSRRGCSRGATGICERVCANASAERLSELAWEGSNESLCVFETENAAGEGAFDTLLATLEVNLSWTYFYRPRAPLTPPSWPLPEAPPSSPPPLPSLPPHLPPQVEPPPSVPPPRTPPHEWHVHSALPRAVDGLPHALAPLPAPGRPPLPTPVAVPLSIAATVVVGLAFALMA